MKSFDCGQDDKEMDSCPFDPSTALRAKGWLRTGIEILHGTPYGGSKFKCGYPPEADFRQA